MIDSDLWWLTPLILALLIGLICPATGSLLITQRRILLANLMAHSVLPGLILALAFELDPTLGGLISGLLGALLAERLNQGFQGREEGAMNTVLAGFTALGVLLVPLLEARVDLETLLFGDLLTAGWRDLLQTVVAAGVSLVFISTQYRPLVFSGVDPDGAESAGLPVQRLRTVLAVVTTLVVVSAIAAVGIILVISLLCAPAVLALQRANSLSGAMVRSSLIGASCSVGGFGLALVLDLPPGPLIGWLCLLLLLLPKNGHRQN